MENTENFTFSSPNEFSQYIEAKALESEMTFLETLTEFCEQHSIDPNDIASKISSSLKDKLEQDFINARYLPQRAQLEL